MHKKNRATLITKLMLVSSIALLPHSTNADVSQPNKLVDTRLQVVTQPMSGALLEIEATTATVGEPSPKQVHYPHVFT